MPWVKVASLPKQNDPPIPEQIASRDARIRELEANQEDLFVQKCDIRQNWIKDLFEIKTLLLKAMGLTDDLGFTAKELAEMLADQTGFRVQKYTICPKCKGEKMYPYEDYMYGGEVCICTKPCDACGRTGFVWETVEVR